MSYIIGMDVTRVDTSKEFHLGTIGMAPATGSAPAKKYKYVEYDEGAAAVDGVLGEVAFYSAPGGTSAGGYALSLVTSDLSGSAEVGAGVLQASLADGEFGWLQIRGPATLSIGLAAEADGGPLTPTGGADGTLDLATAATDHICATADDASADKIICDFPE